MSKPTLIFVPGAYHSPDCYDAVIAGLTPLGYKSIKYTLLAAPASPSTSVPVPDLQPDIAALRSEVESELDATANDVVVVAHSWSGIVASAALKDLGKTEREKHGKANGVRSLAFISAFVPLPGVSLFDSIGGVKPATWINDEEGWIRVPNGEERFYHDLAPAEQAEWTGKLLLHSYATLYAAADYVAWKAIPSRYLVCDDDRAIPKRLQEAMVQKCLEHGAPMLTEHVWSSHSPFLSQPDVVVGFVRRAAGEEGV
ncbi:hypothetical protein BP5796_07116 [Coleophoma crateriformis]|uniref:AB hydrolase-1 domain-containing protein n=1 Tax=Coleophoma crateriformis TaxID=565419 RepID=A0A3D8RIF5_9HELO|nr:hypothetical protein BP5796_07116 [Coleophoma crateriformis]